MLRHSIQRGFSSSFNVLNAFPTLKSIITSPLKHIKAANTQDGFYNPTQINLTTDAFDEVAHEWIAIYTGNPFHLQIYNNLDNIQTTNFGTIDNPCVVFTADAPFRYVGCTGLQNEDDYEQHELHMFMLREGPLQRCSMCGQVFKLVRLRQEFDEEMQYYEDSFHLIDPFEVDNENMQMMNMFKNNTHREPSSFEFSQTNDIINMVDSDVHDRILTDPAYRLWLSNYHHDRSSVVNQILKDSGLNGDQIRHPKYKKPLSKTVYETCLEAEKSWAILERLRKKHQRFQVREYLDHDNHERRERRLRLKQKERWENNYAFFYGGLTEEEQQYRDYFQTDIEQYPEDELLEQRLDQQEILAQPEYSPARFDFQEQYLHNHEEDQTSLLEKKLFLFKYRQAYDQLSNWTVNEKRMVDRQLQRMTKDPEYINTFRALEEAEVSRDKAQILLAEKNYYDLIAKEGYLTYKDYYEGHPDLPLIDALFQATPHAFINVYQNHASQLYVKDGFKTFPKRPWDESKGIISNTVLDFQHFQNNIKPQAQKLANQASLQNILPASEQELFRLGLLTAQAEAQKKVEVPKAKPQIAERKPQSSQQEAPKEAVKEAPKEAAKEAPKEAAKEAPKVVAKEAPKQVAKEVPKETVKPTIQIKPKIDPKNNPKKE